MANIKPPFCFRCFAHHVGSCESAAHMFIVDGTINDEGAKALMGTPNDPVFKPRETPSSLFERLQRFSEEFDIEVDSEGVSMTRNTKDMCVSIKKAWIEIETAKFDILEAAAQTLRSARRADAGR